jgi:hypothetical protein
MRMLPFSPICGRMRSVMPTSLRSMVWNGLAELLLLPVLPAPLVADAGAMPASTVLLAPGRSSCAVRARMAASRAALGRGQQRQAQHGGKREEASMQGGVRGRHGSARDGRDGMSSRAEEA